VPEGRYTVQPSETPAVNSALSNALLRQMEQKLKEEDEKKKRLMDKKRLQKLKKKDLPRAIAETAKSSGAELLHFELNFVMPAP